MTLVHHLKWISTSDTNAVLAIWRRQKLENRGQINIPESANLDAVLLDSHLLVLTALSLRQSINIQFI